MKRLTMSLDDDLGQTRRAERPNGPCIATHSQLFKHPQRQLATRLTDMQHDHRELMVATTSSLPPRTAAAPARTKPDSRAPLSTDLRLIPDDAG